MDATKDLNNSVQENIIFPDNQINEVNDSQNVESANQEIPVVEELTISEPAKKESAADMILRRLAESKKRTQDIDPQENSVEQTVKEEMIEPELEELIPEELHEPENAIEEIEDSDELQTPVTLVNFNELTRQEMLDKFKEVLQNHTVQDIKLDVENLKINFYKKYKAEIAEKRKTFLETGGVPEEFQLEPDALEVELKALYSKYRELRNELNIKIEAVKVDNLNAKYQIIEELKNLINGHETLDKTFVEFKELQRRWREIGLVPQADAKTLWDTYNHHIEKFYDFVNINKELRDLDLKKNLETKIELCEKAEELLIESSIIKAFKTLQKLHNHWRDTGPVPREKKDEIWERFKETTSKINKKYQEYFEKIKVEQENNLNAKTLLCEKAEEISENNCQTHKDWEKMSDEILELQKVWKLIGFAPKKDNNKIYSRFRNACDIFFSKKRDFYAQHKEQLENNLQLKTELCVQAESMKDNTDWKKTTDIYINLQKQWKTIGPVPRKFSDALWKRFRTACNAFFDKKTQHFSSIDSEQEKNLQLKTDLITEVRNFQFIDNDSDNITQLKLFQKRWTEIGHVPFKFKDSLLKEFRDEVNKQFNKISFNDDRRDEQKLRNRLENLQKAGKGNDRMHAEREKIRTKIEQLQTNISVWENNIGFFTKSKNSESMINEFNRKIEDAKLKVKEYKKQIEMVDKYDNA